MKEAELFNFNSLELEQIHILKPNIRAVVGVNPRVEWYSLIELPARFSVTIDILTRSEEIVGSYETGMQQSFVVPDPLDNGDYLLRVSVADLDKKIVYRSRLHQFSVNPAIANRDRINCPLPWGYLRMGSYNANPCCYLRRGTLFPYNSHLPNDPFNSPGMMAVREELLCGRDTYCSPTCSHLQVHQGKDLEEVFKQTYRDVYTDPSVYQRALEAFVRGHLHLEGPLSMRLGVGSACNHECIFCHEIHQNSWEQDEATYEMIERLYLGTLQEMELVGGEPLLAVKGLISRMDAVREKLPYFRFIVLTNGALLHKYFDIFKDWDQLILYVSLNAGTRETYEKVHLRDDFDRVCENLKSIRKIREAEGKNTFLRLSFVYLRMNYKEIPGYIELCRELGANRVGVKAMIYLPMSTVDQPETIMPGDPEVEELQEMRKMLIERCREYGIGFEMKMPGDEKL